MWERLFILAVLLLLTRECYAQANEDSLQLSGNLKNNAAPASSVGREEMASFDESLPKAISPSKVVKIDSFSFNRRSPLPRRMPLDTLRISMEFNLPPPEGLSLGNGIRVNGGLFCGLDILQIFTREFWQFQKRRNRLRTIELLRDYGKESKGD